MVASIRLAAVGDAARLAAFAERTFRETFGPDNRPEDLELYLAGTYGPALQQAEIQDPSTVTLLAEVAGALAAFAQLGPGRVPACVRGPAPIEIRRFYVDRAWQGRGLARQLMAAVLAAAEERSARTAWLAVWERNARAIAFYRRAGFEVTGEQPFTLGTDRQRDLVMARTIGSRPGGPGS